uniref:NPC1 like intracellular cholesterol transporter 1 n=1 Tax=Leptobrachium leishanense TaxID=445787 RepID=A0A8C5MCV0_9ANUR
MHPRIFAVLILGAISPLSIYGETKIHQKGFCSIYGECGLNPEVTSSLIPPVIPCESNTPATQATGAHLQLLREVCPMMYTGEDSTFACCDMTQLESVRRSFALSQSILSRCPSCERNFANIHCQNTCSPDQSTFIDVLRSFYTNETGTPGLGVLEYQCFYDKAFADDTFDSCYNVRLPATGGFAISTMCGRFGHELCTSQRWLDFQGDISNGVAPLIIDFRLLENDTDIGNGMAPLSSKVWKCSESPQGESGSACTCQDCRESCPQIPAPEPLPDPFKVGSLDGYLVVSLVVFGTLLLLFIAFLSIRAIARCCRKDKKTKELPKVTSADLGCAERVSLKFNRSMEKTFRWWGTLVASYPKTVIGISVAVVIVLSCGMILIKLTTDPVELWSSPQSRAREEKDFYDNNFGPFFRTNQLIITVPGRPSYIYDSPFFGETKFNGILSLDIILEVLELQNRLQNIKVWSEKDQKEIGIEDICYSPLNPNNPSVEDCAINSLVQYFQNSYDNITKEVTQTVSGVTTTVGWRDHFLYCVNSPLSFLDITGLEMSCIAVYGAPVFPFLAVGGHDDGKYSEAEALILTISLNNFARTDPRFDYVMLWEQKFLDILKEYLANPNRLLSFSYMAERSLEDEINRTTLEDIPIFTISYLVIFLYIALALGEYSSCRRVMVDSKVTLGIGGILVVLFAVFSSMGFFSYLGVPSSLIIVEVVPFLILAVGADNIFIFVLELQRTERKDEETREQHIGRVLGGVAPSMLLCSISESLCFFLGALTNMPAVRTFALNAAMAILLDFILQITMFVALVSMDTKRQEESRFDICCCCKSKTEKRKKKSKGLLITVMKKFYCPFLLNPYSRVIVMVLFMGMFCCGLYFLLHCPVGLNQELAVPLDSYVLSYLNALNEYFEVGVPTYFVTTAGYDFSTVTGMNAICSSAGCNDNSMTQQIQFATEFSDRSYLSIPASSWVDDFIDWLNPASDCCRVLVNGTFCSSQTTLPGCFRKCLLRGDEVLRPTLEQFEHYLPIFLQDYPNLKCPKGGLGAYDGAVKMNEQGEIIATRFMAYHNPLKNSQEYTAGLKHARELADSITETLRKVPGTDPNFSVFPYTITYVFYEQYLTIVNEGLFTLAICLVPTFAVCCILLGMDLRSGLINLITILMIVVDTVGVMTLWSVDYNAISLINLVTAVGISVEFVSHLTRSFAISLKPDKVARAKEATINMGSAVLAGVAMTNLPGIIVLAFAKAQLIHIFFFRMNLTITLLGMAHGLVFLPVALTYFGPGINKALLLEKQEEEERLKSTKENAYETVNDKNNANQTNNGIHTYEIGNNLYDDNKNTFDNITFQDDEKLSNSKDVTSREEEKNSKF